MSSTLPSAGHFEWVRHRTRGELFDLILDVEDRLRRLVRNVLQATQSLWEELIAESIRVAIVQRKSVSKGSDLLAGATLAQLIDLVLNRWDLFQDQLRDRTSFHTQLNAFRQWRNELAHGKHPTDAEKLTIAELLYQVECHIPVHNESSVLPGKAVHDAVVLWVDDYPEGTYRERGILRTLGIEVVPVRSNGEAIETLQGRAFDLVITDIDRGAQERGDLLPDQLRSGGITVPIIFYVGEVLMELGIPPGAHSIHDDPALLLGDVIKLLSRRARAS